MIQNGKNVSPMSNESRNAYVVEHITAALLELLRDKELAAISISELCEKAGVGRASFYRNFDSKEAVLKAHLSEIFHEWTDEYEKGERPLNQQVGTLFAHFERHREFYALLKDRGLLSLLKDAMIGLFQMDPDQPALEAYSKSFVAYTFYGWVETWFLRGMRESAGEMAELFRSRGL